LDAAPHAPSLPNARGTLMLGQSARSRFFAPEYKSGG
jgi:hypothetical protein